MKKNSLQIIVFLFLFSTHLHSQILGCTDSLSKNYNPKATQNDGSCVYKTTNIRINNSVELNSLIKETSGLTKWNHFLWTFNDDTDTCLYALDTVTGMIQKTHRLYNVQNTDWEEISQDSTYLYVGDFGNNAKGNRTDLQILKIDKSGLLENKSNIVSLPFSYSNQTDFTPCAANKTNFDCEAFVVSNDSIYLFTKEWKSKKTSLYVLSKNPGTQVAQFKTTLNVDGLITGATFLESKKLLVLCGYSSILQPFIYLLYDYKNQEFFSGNKRKLNLKLPFYQIEGITTSDGLNYYLSNEDFTRKPFVSNLQQLHSIDLSSFLEPYLKSAKN